MTSDTRYLVEMADIRGIEITCPDQECVSKLVVSLTSTKPIPGVCPLCGKPMFDPTVSDWASVIELRTAMCKVLRNKFANVRLEIVGMKP
jgi:hypothetical protein